ncbi:MAG: hypothetical protein ABIJ45_02375 [Candidatus Zixiibacteriota bacterium]
MKTGILVFISVMLLLGSLVSADDKGSINLDWYGYFKLDASYDQNITSHGNFVMWVNPKQVEDDAQFNMTHKQSRFGVKVAGNGYGDVKLGGNLEFDMYGGAGTENKAALLLRHAYMTLDYGSFQLLAGQSWDLISPLNPSTLNYPVLWGCGNIGYRRPQIRMTLNHNFSEQTKMKIAAGFFRTIGSDLTPTLVLSTETSDGSDDGTDAAIPSIQGLVDITHEFSKGNNLRLGLGGAYSQYRAEGTLGSDEDYSSQGITGHLQMNFAKGFGFAGEFFSGSNLESFFGGISNSNTIDGISAVGGWGYAWIKLNNNVKFSGGFGLDDPDDNDLTSGKRSKNQCLFANISWSPVKIFSIGLEGSQWQTDYKDSETAETFRMQTSFIFNF